MQSILNFIKPYLESILFFISYKNYLPLWVLALVVTGSIVFLIIKPTPWFIKNKSKILPILGLIIIATLWFWMPKLKFYLDTSISLPSHLSAQEKHRFVDERNRIISDKESYGKNNSGLFNSIGILRSGFNDYSGAVNAFRLAIRKNPEDARFYRNLAIAYNYLEKYQLAEESFLSAFRIAPTQPEYWLELGELYTFKIKDINKAKLFYLEALGKSGDNVSVIQAYARFLENVVQDYPESIKYWQMLVEKIERDKPAFLQHIEELKIRVKK